MFACLFVCLFVCVYGTLVLVSYLMSNPFNSNKQFYFKQFIFAWVDSLIVNKISISSYSVYLYSSNSDNSV